MEIRGIKYEKAYRQGEILIFKVKSIPKTYNAPKPILNGVIREGEKEGHEHKVEGSGQLAMFGEDEGVIKVSGGKATITHPEHKDIKLPEGEYVVKVQKEATGKHSHQSVKD